MTKVLFDEVAAEVVRLQQKSGYPECVPKYVSFHRGGRELWKELLSTTVAECEQICEEHTRLGWAAIERWEKSRRRSTLKRAAYHIFIARHMRCRYISLMGIENSTEADMPFACGGTNDQAE